MNEWCLGNVDENNLKICAPVFLNPVRLGRKVLVSVIGYGRLKQGYTIFKNHREGAT
jgi:hypothetical protein